MRSRISRFTLPLLAKELIEQANRSRLFVVRIAFALLLFGAASFFIVPLVIGRQFTPVGFLGTGREIFHILVTLQFVGIYLFLPALTCGAITAEKERNTLGLLFLTKLDPWTIIIEKLGSRLIPMLSLLLISLPLMAFTYAWGGIEAFDLFCAIWFLLLTILQVGSYAILASSFCRSTPAAYICTLALLLLCAFGLIVLDEVVLRGVLNAILVELLSMQLGTFVDQNGWSLVLLFPPGLMRQLTLNGQGSSASAYVSVIFFGMPTLISVAVSLFLAKKCLLPRAFLPASSTMLGLFKFIDAILNWANSRFTFGIVLVGESKTLPNLRPIEWRELAKRSLSQFRYLVRIFVVLQLPVMLITASFATVGPSNTVSTAPISVVLAIVWFITVLLIASSASNMIASERSQQTLDVLLTSPLSSQQIILEKISGLRRLMLVCTVPLLSCAIFQTWWRYQLEFLNENAYVTAQQATNGLRWHFYIWHEYLAASLLTIAIYLPLVAWVSLGIGIRCRTSTRAILLTLAFLTVICVIPALVSSLLFAFVDSPATLGLYANSPMYIGFLVSPAGLLLAMEGKGLYWLHPVPYLAVLTNSVIYGAALWYVRRRVLAYADRDLGRLSTVPAKQVVNAETVPFAAPVTS